LTRAAALAWLLLPMSGCDRTTRPAAPTPELCVTEGAAAAQGEGFVIDAPKFRAVSARATDQAAELRFTYLGPTAETAPLGSGRERRQIGLKLRAQDACNLVYAMWRIDPASEVVVQVKRNEGQRTSAECENRGYRTVRPAETAPVPQVTAGSTHVLRAAMRGSELSVWADGALVWRGDAGADVLGLEGPVGLRSDNGRFSVAFTAGTDGGAPRGCQRE
jgi:hypothetical protein